MKIVKEQDLAKNEAEVHGHDKTTTPRAQFAVARIQGHYQLQAAKINSEMALVTSKMLVRARYFHGMAALLGAFGVFGGIAFNLYQETKEVRRLTEKLNKEIKSHEHVLSELSKSYDKLADLYQAQNQLDEAKDSRKKANLVYEKTREQEEQENNIRNKP